VTNSRIAKIAAAVALVVVGVALGLVGYHFLTADDKSPWWQAAPAVVIAWTYLGAGLIAWWRRPTSRIGPLLMLVAAALLVRKLQYSGNSTLFTIGFALGSMYAACFAHVVLAYPSGRIRDHLERWFVAVTYAVSFLLPVSVLIAYDPDNACLFNCSHVHRVRPESFLSLTGDHTAFTATHIVQHVGGYGLAGAVFITLIARRWLMSSPHSRRKLAPLLLAGFAAGLRSISEAVFGIVSRTNLEALTLWSIEEAVQIAVPIVLLLGLLGERLARASVADLVPELAVTPPDQVGVPVARALGVLDAGPPRLRRRAGPPVRAAAAGLAPCRHAADAGRRAGGGARPRPGAARRAEAARLGLRGGAHVARERATARRAPGAAPQGARVAGQARRRRRRGARPDRARPP